MLNASQYIAYTLTNMPKNCMHPVTDADLRDHIIRVAARAFGVANPTNTRVPFDNPVSLDRSNMLKLSTKEYIGAFKADGTRYALVLCRFRGNEVACMVDRASNVFEVCVHAAAPHFHNVSVFDGELCACTVGNAQDFVVFDCLTDKGAPLHAAPYTTRLEHVRENFSPGPVAPAERPKFRMYIYADSPWLNIMVKEHDSARNLRAMTHNVEPRYRYDGIVFTPANQPVCTGQDEDMLKYKIENPIDATGYKEKEGDPLTLLVDNGGTNIPIQTAVGLSVDFVLTDKFEEVLGDAAQYHAIFGGPVFNYIMELACDVHGDHLTMRYARLRPDKDGPNNINTVRRTVKTIRDNIQASELYELLAARPAPER